MSVEWHRTVSKSSTFKRITIDFKPTYKVGVLFFMEFHLRSKSANNSSLVSMLNYDHSSLILSTLYESSVISNTVSSTSYNRLYLHIRNDVLRIKLNSTKKWYHYSLKSKVDVKNLFFGGAKDFTAYHQFPIRSYFVGMVTDINMGQDCISVAKRNELNGRQAVLQDNCTTPTPSSVEFDAFSQPLASVMVQPSTHFRVNFTIATKQCMGELLHLSGGSFMLGLSAHKLITRITNSSGHSAVCTSNGIINQSEWSNVMITYVNNTIKYFVNDEESGICHIDLGTVNFTGTLMVGVSNDTSVPFVGHMRQLYWDDSEINLVGSAIVERQLCVGVGPASCNTVGFSTTFSPSCSTCMLHDLPIQWTAFDVSVQSNLTVTEKKLSTITINEFSVSYAGSQCLADAGLHKLYKNINFTLQEPYPAHGSLDPHTWFTYEDVFMNKVHYSHSGTEEKSDVIHLLIQVHCGPTPLFEKSVKLCVHVSSTNDVPEVKLKDVTMVPGTRRLITQQEISMSDVDTPLELVRCIESEVSQGENPTGQFEWTDKPGHKITDSFNQRDINAGKVMLRLFRDSTGTSKAALTVFDGIAENYGSFEIHSTTGKVTLMKNKSIKVINNHSAAIDKFHLVAGTNFGYQQPVVVTYLLTSFPKFGVLSLAHNQNVTEKNVSQFTQYDIDNRMLFYHHTVHIQNATEDCFTLQLMVDEFQGDSGTYCVNILIEEHLPTLLLNVTTLNISALEGEEKLISNNDLGITAGLKSLSGQIEPLPDDVIILLLFMELPKYGSLYLNNSNGTKTFIVGGSNISLDQLTAGLLVYSHLVEEEHQDSFRVTVIAQNFSHLFIQSPPVSSLEFEVFIDITPINNKRPQIQIYTDLVLTEGSHESVTTDIINITDADRPAENLSVYVTPKVAFNGHFASRENNSIAISRFSVKEIIEGQIIFVHWLGSELEENYTFVVSDGLHNSSSEFKVVAKPIILNISTTHSTERCPLRLDLVTSNKVKIHEGLFSIKLNSGSLPNVRLTTTRDSCMYIKNNSDFFPVTSFLKRDIDQGLIWYIVKNNKTRIFQQQFGLNFSIGHAEPVHVQFKVCLDLLPYPQLNVASSRALLLPEHGDIEIDSSVLSSANTRDTESSYGMWYELTAPPTNGQLVMQSKGPVFKFSQSDINGGKIYYYNHNYSMDGDRFILALSNEFYKHTANITVTISIFLLRLKVVNNGFMAKEGGNHTIAKNELYATGPLGYSVMFYIVSAPVHGSIIIQNERVNRFSKEQLDDGLVVYSNDDGEFRDDSMKIRIEAMHGVDTPPHIRNNISQVSNTTYFGTVNITIELVNDHVPRVWNETEGPIEVVDGTLVVITSQIVSFQDDDIDMNISFLRYTVLETPTYGFLFFRHNKSIVSHFLQQNIYDLDIAYQSNKSLTVNSEDNYLDFCYLDVSDGEKSVNHFLFFNIVPFTVEPVHNKNLSLDEGGRMALLDKNLLFTAARAKPPVNDSDYIYNITSRPTHGQLTMPDSCNCTFTQEELRKGFVVYEHDHSDTIKDNFTFRVTVRGYETTIMTFVIIINPVDDEPPSVEYSSEYLVDFGKEVYFNKSVLQATDSEAKLSDLTFSISKAPLFGSIKREITGPRDNEVIHSFTQLEVNEEAIFYQHQKEVYGEWIDNVTLSLSDGKNAYNKSIVITFILIPKKILPLRVNGMKIREGRIEHLSIHNFEVTHPYLSTLELYINVTKEVEYGKIITLYQPSASAKYFNSTELRNSSILYYYGEDYEVTQDTFNFVAMAGKLSSTEQTFVFTIESENDEIPIIVNNSIISVWATEVKLISKDHLFASDSDAHPADKLEYIIGTNTSLGHFAYKGAPHTPITKFSQDSILAGAVVFKSNPTASDTEVEINFTLTDGKHNVESIMTIEINVLYITVTAQDIIVAMGANHNLTCSAKTNDGSREFNYQVLVPPIYGLIISTASGLEVNNFTQEQVNNGLIVYKHTAVDKYETDDVVKLVVSTDLAKPVQVALNISIKLKKSSNSYLAASESLNVDEGGIVCLNVSILDASNVLYELWQSNNHSVPLQEVTIQYIIVSRPSSGKLKIGNVSVGDYFEHSNLKSSTARVCYYHDDSETISDRFSIKINISYNSTDVWYSNNTEVFIPIHVRPLNDEDPVLKNFVKKMYVFESYNYITVIHPEELCISDKDTVDEELTFIIVEHNQSMVVCRLSDMETHNFTQHDVNEGKVKCELPPNVSSSNLIFYFTDGNFISKNYTMHYSKVTLTLSIVCNTSELSYPQEEGLTGVTLTDEHLNSSTTGFRGDTIYTVTSPPINGELIKLNHSGAVSNFTQQDIDNGMINYIATNKASYNDSFTMEVTNRHATPQQVTLHVTALALTGTNEKVLTLSVKDKEPLPAKMFNLTRYTTLNPYLDFTVINELSHGRLYLQSKKRSPQRFSFDNNQLKEGRVLYVLDDTNITNGTEVLQLLVQVDNMQAGFAEVSFNILVLPTTTLMPTATTTSQPLESSQPSGYSRGSAFTLFALVPIIGVPSFILLVVIILVGFWYSQKRKEKRRCAAARGTSAICMGSPHQFTFPIGHNSTDVDYNSEKNSDHSSNNSDEGISMALSPEDQVEDEGMPQRYADDQFRPRPAVMDYSHYYHHPLTSVHTSNTPNPQHVRLQKVPILKNEEYWL